MENLNSRFSKEQTKKWFHDPVTQMWLASITDERDRLLVETLNTPRGERDKLIEMAIGFDIVLANVLQYENTEKETTTDEA